MKHVTSLKPCFLIVCALVLLTATAAPAVDLDITYTYDNAGRLTAVDYGNGQSIAYTYDDAGNISTITSKISVTYTLTVNKTGTGTGTVVSDIGGISCGVTCSSPYAPGTVVTLTATPDSGSGFSGWTGCDTSSGNTCTVTMVASKIVSAAFSLVTAPGKAMLISPSGTITTTTPTYTWNALSNSASYLLYVNDNSGNKVNKWYSADQAGCSGGTGTCSVTPDIPVGGAAKWWIQTWNSVGYGPWSNPLEFTAPSLLPGKVTLVSPSGAIDTNVPAYTWNADAKSAWYWLYVNDSSGNKISQWYSATQAGCPAGTGTCTVAPGIALVAGSGKYWVQTWNSNGSGPWSDGLGFTVPAPVMPGKATLVLPLGITTFNNWPAFTWNAASNTTWYYLWVDDINGNRIKKWYKAAEAGCSSGTGTCSVTPDTALASGSAKWWIQTYNENGYGPWSDTGEFTVPAPVLPSKATLISPSGTISTNTPTYTWNAVSDSTRYLLWVNDSTGNKINTWYSAAQAGCPLGTGTCSVTPDIALAAGSGKWWIDTWNANGSGPWSTGMAFTVSVTSGLKE